MKVNIRRLLTISAGDTQCVISQWTLSLDEITVHVKMGLLRGAFIALVTAITISVLPWIFQQNVPADLVYGSCTKEFAGVEKAYRAGFASGLDRGSALAVYHKGQPVCDLWGGYADEAIGRPWHSDTLNCWWSTTKAMGALSVLTLVDKGLLDVKKPVTHYWPAFGKHGKDKMTVETMLAHGGGLAALDTPLTFDHIMNDPDYVSKALEDQVPNWTPGKKHGYHALSIGLLMDQLIRRVDPKHRPIQQYFKEVIAEPYGIDFFIGTPPAEHHRIARLHTSNLFQFLKAIAQNPVQMKVIYRFASEGPTKQSAVNPTAGFPGSKGLPLEAVIDWPESRVSPQASSHGTGTARAVAKLLGIVANGGKPLFKPSTLQLFNQPVSTGEDEMLGVNNTYGYGVTHYFSDDDQTKHRVGAPGHGGQMGFADINHKFSYSYGTNHLRPVLHETDERISPIIKAIYGAIESLGNK